MSENLGIPKDFSSVKKTLKKQAEMMISTRRKFQMIAT